MTTRGCDTPHRVLITGIGPITASGIGVDRLWAGLQGGSSPVREVTRFDVSSFRSRLAVEIDDFDPRDHMDRTRARRLNRFGQFAVAATGLALADSALQASQLKPERVAVQMGSALGGIIQAEEEFPKFLSKGLKSVSPRLALGVFCGAASCNVAIEFGFTGPNSTNAMSCASGAIAIGDAWRLIRGGIVDVAVAGGIEAPLAPLSFGAFSLIRAMSARNHEPSKAYRPFDEDRDGFVMGEGACVLVLESEAHAQSRNAHVYGEIRGFGTSNDAHHMAAPHPGGTEAARAMAEALAVGEVAPDEVDYVNAHGSSTHLNDATETRVIHSVLGEWADKVLVSGTKPYYGHALGASGAIEAGICALTIERGWVAPTLNLDARGEGCDLDYVGNEGREATVSTAVSNSFGFGGINASLSLRAYSV